MGARKRSCFANAFVCMGLSMSALAQGATINVTTKLDEFGTPGGDGCGLREAVETANRDERFGGCKRMGQGKADTVVVKSGGIYEIALPGAEDLNAGGDLDVRGKLVIRPSGKDRATIDANQFDRAIEVRKSASLTATRLVVTDGLLNTGGENGAGIESHGALVLRDSRVTANEIDVPGGSGSGGGVFTEGRAVLDRVTLHGNEVGDLGDGGGFGAFDGKVKITDSTIVDNIASDGGGIALTGPRAEILSSTINGNTALGENTGGGGIFLAGGAKPTRLTNVTLSANQSNTRGGGIFVFSGNLSLNAATVTGNSADANGNGNGTIGGAGGGLHGSMTARNSIVFGNFATTVDTDDCFNASTLGSNLTGIDSGCSASVQVADAGLNLLGDYGGPTLTHALEQSSPAIGEARKDAPSRDQRGRRRDSHPDLGAFER